MKTLFLFFLTALLCGCVHQPLPKDAIVKGITSKIVTPWGTSELTIVEAATGSAARK